MNKKPRRKRESPERRLQRWLRIHYTPERVQEAQALFLRRDMVTFLTYVRDHKVVGTRSTGNMPLKAIREVTAQFVHPPILDETIGDHVYKLRTEDDVWPLRFLHILADVGGLLVSEPGRQWRLAPDVSAFFAIGPLFQLAFLLWVWWHDVNWLVAYEWAGMGESLPRGFEQVTLTHLRLIRSGIEVPFNAFAGELIEKTKLTWTAQSTEGWHRTLFLRTAIEQMVIDILASFGAVQCRYHDRSSPYEIKELDSFEITPLGAALLDSLLIQRIWQ